MTMMTKASTDAAYQITDRDVLIGELQTRYELRFKDLPDNERPREKMLEAGPGSLSVAELIAVLWGVGTKKEDVLAMAKRTLQEYGEKAISNQQDAQKLADNSEIPLAKACQIVAAFELGKRFYATGRSGRPAYVRNAKQAYEYLKDMGKLSKEHLRGLYLNSRYQVIHDEVISIGSLTSNIVHPREVFQPAVELGAAAVIIAHNHPSGVVEPTNADLKVTRQLLEAGEILGIDLLDHIVITNSRHISILQCLDSGLFTEELAD